MNSEANERKWKEPEDRLNEDMEDHPEVVKPVDNWDVLLQELANLSAIELN